MSDRFIGSLFSLLLLVLVTWSNGKNTENLVQLQNCTKNGTFANSTVTDIYYHIVGNSSSCMHIAWSTVGHPTMYISHTSNVSINCSCNDSFYNGSAYTEHQTKGSVNISGMDSDFSLAIIFKRLVEYNGTKNGFTRKTFDPSLVCNDSEIFDNSSLSEIDFKDCDEEAWSFHPKNATFTLNGSLCDSDANQNGSKFSFSIRTKIPKIIGNHRLNYFPKTLFTENATTFDIIAENYPFGTNHTQSRLALDVFLIHGRNVKNGSIDIKKTTDDEYTPSVFSTYTYNTSGKRPLAGGNGDTEGGYLQWKPISYQSKGRKSTSSQQIEVIPAGEACKLDIPTGLATALYGNDTGNVTRWFVLFGTPGDPTYLSETYDTWTVVVGHGTVPHDSLSPVVIITILVGVGVPAVLILLGGVYVFIKKKPWDNVRRIVSGTSAEGYSKL